MPIRQLAVERFSVVSSKPFDEVIGRISEGIGHPDMDTFQNETRVAKDKAEFNAMVQKAVSSIQLMEFVRLDIGMVLQKEFGPTAPQSVRFIVGNPLIMKEMVSRVPDAAAYAPVTLLVDERPDGVHLSYDTMASFIASYGDPEASKIAEDLDEKVRSLLMAGAA